MTNGEGEILIKAPNVLWVTDLYCREASFNDFFELFFLQSGMIVQHASLKPQHKQVLGAKV